MIQFLQKQRNVAGEMRAAMAAMKFAVNNCMTSLVIHYDYLGIENGLLVNGNEIMITPKDTMNS